ncbi:MAG: GNAT family N-acetyltransferase [Ornithinibacter sp.]
MGSPDVSVRARRPEDLPRLVEVLAAQQPSSGYPVRWPLPMPVEEFIVRAGEIRAWVSTATDLVVGHVSILRPRHGWETKAWTVGTGLAADRLAAVSVLFVDPAHRDRGFGTRLLDTAVAHARGLGLTPVLDVVQEHSVAADLYRRRGWEVVAEVRPPWLPEGRLPVLMMMLR